MKRFIQYIILFALGLALLYFTFRKQDWGELYSSLKSASVFWVVVVMAVTLLCHYIRAVRWKLLLSPLNKNVKLTNVFLTLMTGYFINLGIPRLGEAARCLLLKTSDGIGFKNSFGTVLMERFVDFVCLAVILVFTLTWNYALLEGFFLDHIFNPVWGIVAGYFAEQPVLSWTILASVTVGGVYMLRSLGQTKTAQHTFSDQVVEDLWEGVTTIVSLQQKALFIIFTVAIWVCYFLMTYLWFFAFESTAHLGLAAGLVVMMIGTFGKSVPIQGGGMGAYHFLVANALLLFAVSETDAALLSLVIHGAQTIFYLVLGAACWLLFLYLHKSQEINLRKVISEAIAVNKS